MRIKEIYRGNTPPRDTDSVWIRGKEILLFTNEGWVNVNESTVVDTELDPTSNHPIANSAVASSLDDLEEAINETLGQAETQLSETSNNLIKNKAVYNQYMNEKETKLLLQKVGVIDWENRDFTIQMLEDGVFRWDGISQNPGILYYSVNSLGDFNQCMDDYEPFSENVQLKKGDLISFHTYGPNKLQLHNIPFEILQGKKFNVGGKISSLNCKESTIQGVDGEGQYQKLLALNTGLISAKNLILDAGTGGYTYAQMFLGCEGLKEIPKIKLNSTLNLYNRFNKMFASCTSLKEVEIDINSINDFACQEMFSGCTALSSVKCPATTVVTNGTINWLQGVSPTGTFYKNSQMSSWETGASGIPEGWTVENI